MSLRALKIQAEPSPRLQHLLSAAWAEFRRLGYQRVSIDGIARTAGTSKETIYRHFSGKEALFRATLAEPGAALWQSLPQFTLSGAHVPETLEAFVRTVYGWALQPEHTNRLWMSISVAIPFPELADELCADGVDSMKPLVDYLSDHLAPTVPRDLLWEAVAILGALAVDGSRQVMGVGILDVDKLDGFASRIRHLFLAGCPTPACPLGAVDELLSPQPTLDVVRQREPPPVHIQRLIDTAQAHFFTRGYEDASIDEIREQALVGRGTLYRRFGGKAKLFEAAAMAAAEAIAERSMAASITPSDDIESDLTRAAAAVGRSFLNPTAIALYRSVVAETTWNTELARQVHDVSSAPLNRAIAELLAHHHQAGRIAINEPVWWAAQFMTMATAGNRYLSMATPPLATVELAAATTRCFLRGILEGVA